MHQVLAWYSSRLSPILPIAGNLNPIRESFSETYCADFSNTCAFLGEEDGRCMFENAKVLCTLRNLAQRLWPHIKFHAMFFGQQHNSEAWGATEARDYLDSNGHLVGAWSARTV